MNQPLPNAKFKEIEVDSLIAHFGVKPAPEKRKELLTYLGNQKEQFKEYEINREARKQEPQLGH